jgi:hypothetical protein
MSCIGIAHPYIDPSTGFLKWSGEAAETQEPTLVCDAIAAAVDAGNAVVSYSVQPETPFTGQQADYFALHMGGVRTVQGACVGTNAPCAGATVPCLKIVPSPAPIQLSLVNLPCVNGSSNDDWEQVAMYKAGTDPAPYDCAWQAKRVRGEPGNKLLQMSTVAFAISSTNGFFPYSFPSTQSTCSIHIGVTSPQTRNIFVTILGIEAL